MSKLNVYLNFAGNTEEAFSFYRSVLGGKFETLERFKDMPKEGGKVAKNEESKILNITLPVGDSLLMASDTLGSRGQKLVQGNNFYISISPGSKQEADRIFNALSEDGRVILPISDQPWNAYYGSFTDKFGVRWMVNYTYPKTKPKAEPVKTRPGVKVKAQAKKKTAAVSAKAKTAPVKARAVRKPKVKAKPAPGRKKAVAPTVKNKPKARLIPKRKTTVAPTAKSKVKRETARLRNIRKRAPGRELVGAGSGKNR